ncbi:MAG: hypothetical protein GYA61_07750 [Spirochaetales bacterium]|nr:hypothetical protein [Spirochaetales bacterium]
MILNFQKVELEKINKNFKPLIDFSAIDKDSLKEFHNSIFLNSKNDGYIPIVLSEDPFQCKSILKSLIVEYEVNTIKEIIEDIKLYNDDYYLIVKRFGKIILNKDSILLKDDFIEKYHSYQIFSLIFIMIFFKNTIDSKPSILLYLLFLLANENPKIIEQLKDIFKLYGFFEKIDFIPKDFYIYLISIDADRSLLLELKNLIGTIYSLPKSIEIIKYILICKLNKNRLRRLIFEIYRLVDLEKFDEFISIMKQDDEFFNDLKITNSQKEIRLSNIINKIINPSFSSRNESFNKLLNSLKLSLINIKPSLSFEKNEFSISANIKNQKELEILKDEIIKLAECKDKIFDF